MSEKIILAQDAVYVSQEKPRQNYGPSGKIKVGFLQYPDAVCSCSPNPTQIFERIGLVQFGPFVLPEHSQIKRILLHLFVLSANCKTNCILIFPNKEPFDQNTVTWETRPPTGNLPVSTLIVRPENQGRYLSCDITPILAGACREASSCFGLSLVAERKDKSGAVFCAAETAHPAYASVEYEKITDPVCPPACHTMENIFYERIFQLDGADFTLFSPAVLTQAAQTLTFFVKNTGANSFRFHLQISPDGTDFIDDKQLCTINPGELQALTPYLFAKYIRTCVSPVSEKENISAQIWCQMQTRNYGIRHQQSVLPE